MCKSCYDHNWRVTHHEQALEKDRRRKQLPSYKEYQREYAHRPEVIERRKERDARRRQTQAYKDYYQPYFRNYFQMHHDDPPTKEIRHKAATRYNRTEKAKATQARHRSKPRVLERRREQRKVWGEITDYNASERERHYFTTRRSWGWAAQQDLIDRIEALGYRLDDVGIF